LVGQHSEGHGDEPRPGFFGGDVLQSPPGDDEDLGGRVPGIPSRASSGAVGEDGPMVRGVEKLEGCVPSTLICYPSAICHHGLASTYEMNVRMSPFLTGIVSMSEIAVHGHLLL
jgi:hypothetical protein